MGVISGHTWLCLWLSLDHAVNSTWIQDDFLFCFVFRATPGSAHKTNNLSIVISLQHPRIKVHSFILV